MAKSSKLRKFFIIFILIVLVLGVGSGAFLWTASYSEGNRIGRVIKLSNKGYLFKTWEGELNMESLGHSKSTAGLSTVWQFSVDDSSEEVHRKLDSAMVNNLRVKLMYSEKFMLISLRGETKYFITDVDFPDAPSDAQKTALEQQINPMKQIDSLTNPTKDSTTTLNDVETVSDTETGDETDGETLVNFEIENNGCYAPCEIQLQNLSQNAVAYFWDFGDGDKSDETQPSHSFQTAGNYEVKLKAIRKDGSKVQKSKWVVVR